MSAPTNLKKRVLIILQYIYIYIYIYFFLFQGERVRSANQVIINNEKVWRYMLSRANVLIYAASEGSSCMKGLDG